MGPRCRKRIGILCGRERYYGLSQKGSILKNSARLNEMVSQQDMVQFLWCVSRTNLRDVDVEYMFRFVEKGGLGIISSWK